MSNSIFDKVLASASDLICVIDQQGSIVLCSDSHHRLLGYDISELLGEKMLDHVLPEDRIRFQTLIDDAFEKAHLNQVNFSMKCKSGAYISFESELNSFVYHQEPHLSFISRKVKDLSKIGEEESDESMLKDAEKIAKLGSWKVNMLTMDNWWSEGNYELYGIRSAEPPSVKSVIKDHLHPEDGPKVLEAMRDVAREGKERDLHLRIRDDEKGIGGYRYFQTRIRPFHSKGELIEIKGTNLDITELVRIQKTLEAKNEELIKLNSKLAGYAYKNAHDLRAPLSSILGIIQLMKSDGKSNELTEMLEIEANELDRVIGQINHILTLESKEGVKPSDEQNENSK